MCSRSVTYWGYVHLASLGTAEAEKVWRSHVRDSIGEYLVFKQNVKTIFGKFEFEGSYHEQL